MVAAPPQCPLFILYAFSENIRFTYLSILHTFSENIMFLLYTCTYSSSMNAQVYIVIVCFEHSDFYMFGVWLCHQRVIRVLVSLLNFIIATCTGDHFLAVLLCKHMWPYNSFPTVITSQFIIVCWSTVYTVLQVYLHLDAHCTWWRDLCRS